jgi:hypothetical protein
MRAALYLCMEPRRRMEVRPVSPSSKPLPNIGHRIVSGIASFFTSAKRARRLQPERRSGVRIVTLKNAAWLALSVVVLFVAYSSYMEHRSRGTSDYGRLYDSRIDATTAPPPSSPPDAAPKPPR